MTQRDLNRAVARATGESADTIARMGFQLASSEGDLFDQDSDLGPQTIDWDAAPGSQSSRLLREVVHAPAFA
jgi:hypothetical protein